MKELIDKLEVFISHVNYNCPNEFLNTFSDSIKYISKDLFRGFPYYEDNIKDRLESRNEHSWTLDINVAKKFTEYDSEVGQEPYILVFEDNYGIDVQKLWESLRGEVSIIAEESIELMDNEIVEVFIDLEEKVNTEKEVVIESNLNLCIYHRKGTLLYVEEDPMS